MQTHFLGNTGLKVSRVAFGAGPVSGLMTEGSFEDQLVILRRAIELGINWIDTAAGYGAGKSEAHLGRVLVELRDAQVIHVATKVRVTLTTETDIRRQVIESVGASLSRLQLPRVALLQLHNSVTRNRNDEPTSITPEDVLGPTGILAAFQELRSAGLVGHFGLTGIGQADALNCVIKSGHFATIQAPFHMLNPTSLYATPWAFTEPDYGGFLKTAHDMGMGIFAIRGYAAGALLCAPPSKHTLTTPFFPLALYERDLCRARFLASQLGSVSALRELVLRFVFSQPKIDSVILGFGQSEHIDEAERILQLGPLTVVEHQALEALMMRLREKTP